MSHDPCEGFAQRYDRFGGSFGEHDPNATVFFSKLVRERGVHRVLDCACGTGKDLHLFHTLGCEVMGSDVSASMLAQARANLAQCGLTVPLYQADYRELSRELPGPFDAVVCLSGSIMHMPDDIQVQRAFQSRRAVLREGGILVLTQGTTDKQWADKPRFILAIGDMHKPNRLNIPGEDLPHVSHYFHDVHPYFRKRLLIVGGRNSAAEAALRCWRAGAEVTLSYRQADFDAQLIKHWILPDLKTQIELGTIGFEPLTVPVAITPEHVVLERPRGQSIIHSTDFVLLLTGYVADMRLFEVAGVTLVGESQAPVHDPETMETDVPGLYVAGTAAAGKRQARYALFIENTHVHVGRIVRALTGRWPAKLGTIPSRRYDLPLEAFQDN